jgi:type VI secretion system secreted protein Hcp
MAELEGYIKFDGIDGESTDDKHQKWCELISFNIGASSAGHMGAQGAGGSGKVHLHDVTVTKHVDSATPKLFDYCVSGKHIKKAQIQLTTTFGGAQQVYLDITLTDVFITSIHDSHTGGDEMGQEVVALGYATIKKTYTPYDQAGKSPGKVEFGWDTQKHKAN